MTNRLSRSKPDNQPQADIGCQIESQGPRITIRCGASGTKTPVVLLRSAPIADDLVRLDDLHRTRCICRNCQQTAARIITQTPLPGFTPDE